MNKILIVIIAIIVVLGAWYYLMNKNSGGNAVQAPTAQTQTPSASNATATVSIQNFAFSPATLAIKAGTTVTWTNNDSVTHTVTSDTGGLFSQTLAPGQSFTFTFASPDSVSYHCAIHPMMEGTVSVEK